MKKLILLSLLLSILFAYLWMAIPKQNPFPETPEANQKNALAGTLKYDTITILNTQTHEFIAEGNVTLINHDGIKVTGESLHWFPEKRLINVKSSNKVKVWHDNKELVAEEVFIYLNENSSEPTDSWKKIEAKGGSIKITREEEGNK